MNGNLHVFNVNESESRGPYMARYLGIVVVVVVIVVIIVDIF